MTHSKFPIFTAALAFATVFTISCSGDEANENPSLSSASYGDSSSSIMQSSSSYIDSSSSFWQSSSSNEASQPSSSSAASSSSSIAPLSSSSSIALPNSSSSFSNSSNSNNDLPTACNYKPEWCGGINLNSLITPITEEQRSIIGSSNTCLFFKNLSGGLQFASAVSFTTIKINNISVPLRSGGVVWFSDLPNKSDGGYYVYLPIEFPTDPSVNWLSFGNATNNGEKPECSSFENSSSGSQQQSSSSQSSSSQHSSSSLQQQNNSSSSTGNNNIEYGSFEYGGKTYKTGKIGSQWWMAENLNYATGGSKCYNNLESNCNIYGRLYDWATALTVCPEGWHLPSDSEWTTLTDYAGGISSAGTKLKAKSGWNENGNGTDEWGFSALQGGSGGSDDYFSNVGSYGLWWSSSEYNARAAYGRDIFFSRSGIDRSDYSKTNFISVRCVKD